MKVTKEGVLVIYDDKNKLIGIVHKDLNTHANIFRKCPEMSFEEIGIFLSGNEKSYAPQYSEEYKEEEV